MTELIVWEGSFLVAIGAVAFAVAHWGGHRRGSGSAELVPVRVRADRTDRRP